ncbi:hypothetical protein BN2475_690023 [Paraburkholderia ribeironis]|uniref:Uncharacterized protein n=1 Tax=Paraburkholderia ribeironis TaxID=1247936 RepID=A0A1N7SHA1_9BURK|nr:hypothetical protein BN2475_690023 [Paraburkholderia ribeironis]
MVSDAAVVSFDTVFAMNSRKIKTSRTFYGKSDISDPLATLALGCASRAAPEVSQKKNDRSAAKTPNFPNNFDPNQVLKRPREGETGIIAGSLNRIFDGWVVHCFHVFIGSGNVQSEQCIAVAVCSQPAASHGLL